MSAEPGRTKAYSPDLRWRVVWQRIAMELSYRDIAERLCISVGTAYNTFQLFQRTGSVDAKPPSKRPDLCKLDDHHQLYIISMVLDNPTLYLGEICTAIKDVTGTVVVPSTVCKLLGRYGFSRKKIQHIALQRNLSQRASFIANISCYPKEMLVWVDETGCERRDLLRKYGYSFRGMRAECKRLLVRGTRISAIAAMCWDKGILDVEMTSNSVNGEMFCDFVRGTLIPCMLPFDGLSPTSIVVMDNCSIHHVAEVKSMLEDAGILLLYLPPYSPDLNPIEEAFGYVKGYLKSHDDIAAAFPNPTSLIQSAFDSITIEHCKAWINHSKY